MLSRYGRSLGICFQLVDDLLDFTARESEIGKPVLSDLKEGKLTLPLILLLPRVQAAQRRLVERVLEDRSFGRVSPQEILELVRGGGDDRGGHRDGRGVRGRGQARARVLSAQRRPGSSGVCSRLRPPPAFVAAAP